MKPRKKFTTYFGVVCRIDVQMTWIPHAHPKPKSDKSTEYLNFFDLGILTCSGGSKGGLGEPWPSQIFGCPQFCA